jgi:Asp-tRNA(Asn)/Glu-tRNA(Gln) amidotransferase A subunit family amidase
MPGALMAIAAEKTTITGAMIDDAAAIADVHIADDQKKMLLDVLNNAVDGYEAIYKLHMPNSVAPSLVFDPVPGGMTFDEYAGPAKLSPAPRVRRPRNLEKVAFWSVRELGELIRTRQVTATELTTMYLARLKRYDPQLKCVITLTEARALKQAAQADREIAAGHYRGPLHGLPWVAKDLLAVKGYRTTWGAGGFEHQMIDDDATVVQRLDAAGAILIAKLTLGALAQGDHWFGGMTRNPWNLKQGSSGSSAGPASATAAGCVAFSIGSETLGSISSPSTRCGATGLRPTFGRVPRTGAMALSWSMDKLGPICRYVEDTAIVLDTINGPDGHDKSVKSIPFAWNAALDYRTLRVGYLKNDFALPAMRTPAPAPSASPDPKRDAQRAAQRARFVYDHDYDVAALAKLRAMGVQLVPVELPHLPFEPMVTMLLAESAAAFDELTRTGRDKLLTEQHDYDWPNTFRAARFIPAVEYIQAARARTLAIEAMAKAFAHVDVVVAPTNSQQLTVTNLTGHPAVIVRNGVRGADAPQPYVSPEGDINDGGPGTPLSLTFLGQLYGEGKALALAHAYERATGFAKQHPPRFVSGS